MDIRVLNQKLESLRNCVSRIDNLNTDTVITPPSHRREEVITRKISTRFGDT
jgi:hypothetical protein